MSLITRPLKIALGGDYAWTEDGWTGVSAPSGYVVSHTPASGYTNYSCIATPKARIGTTEGQNEYATVDEALQYAQPMAAGTVVYVLDSTWTRTQLSTTWLKFWQYYYTWGDNAKTFTRRDTTDGEGTKTVTAADAKAARDAVAVVPVSEAVLDALNGASYETYFQKSAKDNGDGTWTVTVALSKTQVLPDETDVVQDVLDAALNDEAHDVAISTKPGLYYSLNAGSEVTNMTEGERELAKGNTITLDKVYGAKFYQVLINTLPK